MYRYKEVCADYLGDKGALVIHVFCNSCMAWLEGLLHSDGLLCSRCLKKIRIASLERNKFHTRRPLCWSSKA